MGNSNRYSFAELVIYGFVKNYFPDALSRHIIADFEVDIYIPSLKCVIEIDENQCGKNKIELINRENRLLNDLEIIVIRIRENSLNRPSNFDGAIITTRLKIKGELPSTINQLMSIISKQLKQVELKEKLESFQVTSYDIDLNAPRFISKLYDTPVHPNVLDYAGGQLWDYELNGDLNPSNVNFQNCDEIPINFVCPEKSIRKQRQTRKNLRLRRWCVDKNEIDPNDREELLVFEFKKKDCSMVRHCEKRCDAFKRFILFMIKNYIPVYPGTMMTDFLCTNIIIEHPKALVEAILSPDCPNKFLQSMRFVYHSTAVNLPSNWVKTDDDLKKYKKVEHLLCQEVEKDKAEDLFTKYSYWTVSNH